MKTIKVEYLNTEQWTTSAAEFSLPQQDFHVVKDHKISAELKEGQAFFVSSQDDEFTVLISDGSFMICSAQRGTFRSRDASLAKELRAWVEEQAS